ncbi:MAG: methyltransferase [Hydrogenophaga sp.]|uniref:methyltransferase n=1 Tax=Hydrogenophaga sp. TaxID=1904254 RepID=UPI0026038D45|nr:methyltransferase [Hydrogenophaga sp.]MDM7941692.1 methyltransferase [Hydrogenophaga sp.]
MTTLDSFKPIAEGPPPSWRERLASRIDRWMTSPALNRWASRSPLTRWLVRRRSAQLFDLMAGFVHTQVLLACVRLKLFEQVLDAPRTADELATLCRLPTAQLQRLLDSAVALHLLERRGGARYGLGRMGAPVVAHAGIRDMVEHNAVLYDDMRDPLALLRDPNAARMHAWWPYTEDPAGQPQAPAPGEQFARYSSLMSTSQRFVIEELLASYSFAEHRVVLDVGGGMGGWVSALARRHPHLQLQLFDLPPVAALASEQVQRQGLGDRISTHGGSFTKDALPRGADLVTLVRVAHDHPDGDVRTVLRAIFNALPLGGALLLAEPMAQAGGAPEPSDPYFHFYLMAMGSGRLRTPAELTSLMEEAGFTHIERVPNPIPLHAQLLLGRKSRDEARGLPGKAQSSVTFS